MTMNPQWKQPWIDALRSGKYAQTQNWLKNNQGMCCLGVLCDVAGAKWNDDEISSQKDIKTNPSIEDGENLLRLGNSSMLTKQGEIYFGISSNHAKHLMQMNDKQRLPFAEIADYIEENL